MIVHCTKAMLSKVKVEPLLAMIEQTTMKMEQEKGEQLLTRK